MYGVWVCTLYYFILKKSIIIGLSFLINSPLTSSKTHPLTSVPLTPTTLSPGITPRLPFRTDTDATGQIIEGGVEQNVRFRIGVVKVRDIIVGGGWDRRTRLGLSW